jgi:hypothetical protein
MGINTSIAKLLVRARLHGVSFARTGTIGRQSLAIPKKDVKAIARKLGVRGLDWSRFATNGFADDFFRSMLGSESLQSIDYSDYEGVDIVHDLNAPVPETLHGSFDALIDGGSLEHIFDVKQALANYMNMVKVGGCVFVVTTANNMCGHGFYQFSPEFFYRVFGHANGFIVNDAILIEYPLLSVETSRHQRCFRVVDPAKIGQRVDLITSKPVLIFVHATRISNEEPFRETPLQSDYREKWQPANPAQVEVDETAEPFRYLSALEEFKGRLRQARENSLSNDRFFEPLERVI